MAKLFKWLMVLLIPLFSLTLTSCGDDDKDEPDYLPTDNFLVGKWSYQKSDNYYRRIDKYTLSFESDGKYNLTREEIAPDPDYGIVEEERGTYSYSNGILTTVGRRYWKGTFNHNVNAKYDVFFDDYTSRLIISYHEGSGLSGLGIIQGQYSRIE